MVGGAPGNPKPLNNRLRLGRQRAGRNGSSSSSASGGARQRWTPIPAVTPCKPEACPAACPAHLDDEDLQQQLGAQDPLKPARAAQPLPGLRAVQNLARIHLVEELQGGGGGVGWRSGG